MTTVTKDHLVKQLFKTMDISKDEAREIVNLFFNQIADALVRGENIRLSGFGNFSWRDKRERMGRNPRTGEDIPISARRVVVFKAGQKLKNRVLNEC